MGRYGLSQVIGMLFVTLLLVGCVSPTPAVIIVTPTPEPIKPSAETKRITPISPPRPSASVSVPRGQVRGILIDKAGRQFSNEIGVFLGEIRAEGGVGVDFTRPSDLTDSGAFLIKDVAPGKYCLALYYKQSYTVGFVLKEGKVLTFEMPQDRGIDLGRIDASQVYFPEH
jgi:hypothetical protein